MIKRITGAALSLALAGLLILFPPDPPAAEAGTFKDTGSHWSGRMVEKAYALDIMTGYPGNVFKPEDPVSRLEAIAIILRAMGLEDQAKNTDYKNSGVILPQGMFWGQGHLVVAVRQNLLDASQLPKLKFKDPISRQEVATLMAVALKNKLGNWDISKLTFTDKEEIYYDNQVDYRKYVAQVTQNNIMQGLENHRFGPNEIMKRGQMAALMVNAVEDGWFEYGSGKIIKGNLESLDSATGAVKISGDILRLVDSKTVLYMADNKPASLADFSAGSTVTGIADTGAKFKYLEIEGEAATSGDGAGASAEFELTGRITDRAATGGAALTIRDSGYQNHTYNLDQAVVITGGTGSSSLSDLVDGEFVKVKIKDNVIQSIERLKAEEADGEVTSAVFGYLVIQTSSGEGKVYTVNSDKIRIAQGSRRLPFTDLKAGDRVTVVSVAGEAREITLPVISSREAEIRTVDSYYRMITVRFNDGTRKEYEVEINAVIDKGFDSARLDDLKQGDRVKFTVGTNDKIQEIKAVGEGVRSVSGEVTEIAADTNPRIYVDSKRYYLGSHVEITRDGDTIDLDDISVGSDVSLELDEDDMVTSIEVEDDENIIVSGEVIDVDEDRNRITIEQSNGREFEYRVESDCSFRDMTSSPREIDDLGDVREGWEVKLYLENGRVYSLRVTDR